MIIFNLIFFFTPSFFLLALRFGCAGLLQRSSAQALSEITTEVLRAINATEKAVCESVHGDSQHNGPCAPLGGQHPSLEGGKEVAEAYRELEENVRFLRVFWEQGGNAESLPDFLLSQHSEGLERLHVCSPYVYEDPEILP